MGSSAAADEDVDDVRAAVDLSLDSSRNFRRRRPAARPGGVALRGYAVAAQMEFAFQRLSVGPPRSPIEYQVSSSSATSRSSSRSTAARCASNRGGDALLERPGHAACRVSEVASSKRGISA
jgi:hypothetical protein